MLIPAISETQTTQLTTSSSNYRSSSLASGESSISRVCGAESSLASKLWSCIDRLIDQSSASEVASMASSGASTAAAAAVVLLVVAAMAAGASAQCGNVNSLAACLSAASKGTQPTAACCQAMAAFAQYGTPAGQTCLCQAISNPAAKAAGAQVQYAILIPQKCNLNYKAGYVCNGVVVPGGHA